MIFDFKFFSWLCTVVIFNGRKKFQLTAYRNPCRKNGYVKEKRTWGVK